MKKLMFLIFISFCLCSCAMEKGSSKSSSSSITSSEIEHSYSEIQNLKISWNSTFSYAKPYYFVYFYSLTCSHCASLKNRIIEYGLTHEDIYFCEDSSDVVIKENIDSTIGCKRVEDLAIKGFPSLIKIEDKVLKINVVGVDKICSVLSL